MGLKEFWSDLLGRPKQTKSTKDSKPPKTPEPKKDKTWSVKEWRNVTMIVGEMVDSKRAVYVYIDHSIPIINKLIEENEYWLHEELVSYPRVYTEGAVMQYKPKGRYLSSKQKVKTE